MPAAVFWLWDGGTGDAVALHRPGFGGGLGLDNALCCFVLGRRDCVSLGGPPARWHVAPQIRKRDVLLQSCARLHEAIPIRKCGAIIEG